MVNVYQRIKRNQILYNNIRNTLIDETISNRLIRKRLVKQGLALERILKKDIKSAKILFPSKVRKVIPKKPNTIEEMIRNCLSDIQFISAIIHRERKLA